MARFSSFLIFFFSIILLTLVSTSVSQTFVESSPPLSQTVVDSKITIGSSISASAAGGGAGVSSSTITNGSFWLSPSGLFSFGFYPLNTYHQDYIIGIWNNNNPTRKTLVWSINRDDSPLSNATSLLLNHDGKFVIQFSNGTKEIPMFHQQADSLFSSPVSYASILDNGNLVFYNSNSTIIWESFGYPTDTILPGQTLHPEQSLVSSVSESDRSSVMKNASAKEKIDENASAKEKTTQTVVVWDTEEKISNQDIIVMAALFVFTVAVILLIFSITFN